MKRARIWVLVADGARARFLRVVDRKTGAVPVDDKIFALTKGFTRELGREKPGRVHDSHGSARHAIQPRVDLHEQAERDFLKDIVRKLLEAHEAGAFDDLIVVAPPKALGVVREIMPERLSAHVSLEIAGDYTRYNDEEVSRLLMEHLPANERVRV